MIKFQPIISKVKALASSNLWSKTSGGIVFVFGFVAVAADALEIKEKLFGSDAKKEQVLVIDSIQESKTAVDSNTANILKTSPATGKTKKTVDSKLRPPKTIYFNENEFLLENSSMAVFIKNRDNQLDQEFQQRISDDFLNMNVNASSTFFTKASMAHYNQFYTANQGFLKTTKIGSHTNKYLIGSLKEVKTTSSVDAQITIVHLKFQGKLVDVGTNTSKIISKEVRETNYQEHLAVEDAYSRLSEELVETF